MSVAIVDYGSGNLHSVRKAFERCARDLSLDEDIFVTDEPDRIRGADRIVLPGVGAFADCRRGLFSVVGMVEALTEAVRGKGRPFLGICVGMQLLATRGLEHGEQPGLDWIAGEVVVIKPSDSTLKIPHMGWNTLTACADHPLLSGLSVGETGLHAYFVHSYHLAISNKAQLLATTEYGAALTAMVADGNIAGAQFHPEKSQTLGMGLIRNFLRWKP